MDCLITFLCSIYLYIRTYSNLGYITLLLFQVPHSGFRYHTYATKKTLVEGLLDIGLLMANAAQLKALISLGPGQDFYYANLVLLIISLSLQLVVGVILVIHGSMEGRNVLEKRSSLILNNVTVGLVFTITVANVFIAAFGIKLSE